MSTGQSKLESPAPVWPIGLMALLLFSTTISYVDRQALSIAAPVLRKQFGMSNTHYSWLLFSFLLAYAIFHPVMGRFIDRVGARIGMSVCVAFWSVSNMLHALAGGVWSFASLRFLLGAGEAGNFPGCVKVVSENFTPQQRPFATGCFNVGAGLGALIAPPFVTFLIIKFGWQAAFVVTGGIGFLWVAAWLTLYRSSAGTNLKVAQSPGQLATGPVTGWRILLAKRQVWGLMMARFVSDPAWYFYLFWLPEYLHAARGFSLQQIGYFAWIPFLSADLGSLAGGWINTSLMRHGVSVDRARKVTMAAFAALMPSAIVAGYASKASTAIVFVSLATFAHQAWSAGIITLPADLFPSSVVGSVYGLSASSSSVGAMVFMLVIGWVVDHFSYLPIFVAVSLMHPLAMTILFLTVKRIEIVSLG